MQALWQKQMHITCYPAASFTRLHGIYTACASFFGPIAYDMCTLMLQCLQHRVVNSCNSLKKQLWIDCQKTLEHAVKCAEWKYIVMTALGTQWGTDRDCITPRKTLKHTYYEEAGGCEMWKLHQMDRTTENHNTSYSVPAGHPLISCVCFSSLVASRGKECNKNSCIGWPLKHVQI